MRFCDFGRKMCFSCFGGKMHFFAVLVENALFLFWWENAFSDFGGKMHFSGFAFLAGKCVFGRKCVFTVLMEKHIFIVLAEKCGFTGLAEKCIFMEMCVFTYFAEK